MTKTSMELQSLVFSGGSIIIDAKDSEEKMRKQAKPMLKNQYGQLKVIDEMKEVISSDTFTHPGMTGSQE